MSQSPPGQYQHGPQQHGPYQQGPHQHGAQPYLAQNPTPVWTPPVKKKAPNPIMPLAFALGALVLSLVLSWFTYDAIREVTLLDGPGNLDTKDALGKQIAIMMILQVLPTALGITAVVLAIKAINHPTTKRLGIFGLVIALVAPVISLAFFGIMVSGL